MASISLRISLVSYIDRSKRQPLTLRESGEVFPDARHAPETDDVMSMLDFIHELIRQYIPRATPAQEKFLERYFHFIKINSNPKHHKNSKIAYNAMLPLPEMQIYVHDPLDKRWSFEPTNNFRVDFGFWDGRRLVAVEIDGNDPGGYASDVRRDRLLRRADVDVTHILNTEVMHNGFFAVTRLLPYELVYEWRKKEAPELGPFFKNSKFS
jgi:hypothetical protein